MGRFVFVIGFLILPAWAHALSADEIIKLKRAGVADSTIELLIEKDAVQQKRSGIVRQNGWIVHTTDTRETAPLLGENYGPAYPIQVYPQVGGGRRR